MVFQFWCLYFFKIFYTVSIGLQYNLFSDDAINQTRCNLLSPESSFSFRDGWKSNETFDPCFFVLFFLSPFRPSHKLTEGGQVRQDIKIHGKYPYELFISLSIDNVYKSLGFEAQLFSSHNTDIMWSLLFCIDWCTWRYWHRLQYSILYIY